MVESIAELRRRLQEPVRPYNDVAGVFVGDWVSLPITRAFLALGLSPTVGTIGMLVCGLVGSALLLFGDGAAAVGFALVFLYYVFDCVDGEVARYHGTQKLVWGFHEFFFHLYVKSAFFLCLGFAAAQTTGRPWMLAFGLAALLATLYQKFLRDVALTQTCRATLLRGPGEDEWVLRQLAPDLESPPPARHEPATERVPYPDFGGPLATLRAIGTNFDLSLLLFLAAAILDLFLPRFEVLGTPFDLKVVLYVYYGVVLPVHFFDHLRTHARERGFLASCRELVRRAHHFRADR